MKDYKLGEPPSHVICSGFLMLLLLVFVLNISSTLADDPPYVVSPPEITITPFVNYQITEINFNDTFVYTTTNTNFGDYPIVWENNNVITEVRELPSNSIAIELPNNQICIKLTDENKFLKLVDGSTFINVDGSYFIGTQNENFVISTSKPMIIYDEINTSKIMFSQWIDKLDEYKVTAVFDELYDSLILGGLVTKYTVDWGDNTMTIGDASSYQLVHTYKKSGTYPIVLSITDFDGNTYNVTKNYTINYEGHLRHTYLIVDEYKEPIAATSAGMGGIALLGFALTETGKYKFLAFLTLLMPMYMHVQKDDVLDQFVRGEIYGLVKTNPGVCYNEIMKKLDMKNGTLSYHLHMLEKTEMVKSRREGLRYRAFYPTGMKFPEEERYRLTELQLDILKIITADEGVTQKEIAKQLNKKPQTINYNIKILQQSELIRVRKQGRKTGCYILKDFSDNQNEIP